MVPQSRIKGQAQGNPGLQPPSVYPTLPRGESLAPSPVTESGSITPRSPHQDRGHSQTGRCPCVSGCQASSVAPDPVQEERWVSLSSIQPGEHTPGSFMEWVGEGCVCVWPLKWFCPLQRNTDTTFNSWYGSSNYRLIILYLASFTYPVLKDRIIPLNVCSFTRYIIK